LAVTLNCYEVVTVSLLERQREDCFNFETAVRQFQK
jgi:hypothetical protein